jgi:hypothetical protein
MAPADAVEMHQMLPQASRFARFFERAGLIGDDYQIPLVRAAHRLDPGGIHTQAGGDWTGVWDEYSSNYSRCVRTSESRP